MRNSVDLAVASFLGENAIDWEKLKPVACFVVLWNRLEARCGQHFNVDCLKNAVHQAANSKNFDLASYEPQTKFFRDRYINQPDRRKSLFFGSRANEGPIKECFLKLIRGEDMEREDHLKAVLYVPYRIRNNLFHGNKETVELYNQKSLFEHVNQVLCQFHMDLF